MEIRVPFFPFQFHFQQLSDMHRKCTFEYLQYYFATCRVVRVVICFTNFYNRLHQRFTTEEAVATATAATRR